MVPELCNSKRLRLLLFSLSLVAAGAAGICPARASACSTDSNNIVADCSFDNEDAAAAAAVSTGSPVTTTTPITWTFSGGAGIDNSTPDSLVDPSNLDDAFLGTGSVMQSLTLTPGTTYSISFSLAANGNTINNAADFDQSCALDFLGYDCYDASVIVSFDGQTLDTLYADNGLFTSAGGYVNFSYTQMASGGVNNLVFTSSQDPDNTGIWYLDEVSVDPLTPVTIPEPASAAVLLAALAGLPALRRFRRC
jgi:hypothetical protein